MLKCMLMFILLFEYLNTPNNTTRSSKQETQASSGLGRYISFSSVGSWLSGIDWRVYGDYTHFLTLPDKGLPVYFNGSSATVTAITANILAIGLGKDHLNVLASKQGQRSGVRDIFSTRAMTSTS